MIFMQNILCSAIPYKVRHIMCAKNRCFEGKLSNVIKNCLGIFIYIYIVPFKWHSFNGTISKSQTSDVKVRSSYTLLTASSGHFLAFQLIK